MLNDATLLHSQYCVCTFLLPTDGDEAMRKTPLRIMDVQTFANPNKRPEAKRQCRERAKVLREQGRKGVQPMIVSEIPDIEEWDVLVDRIESINNHFGRGRIGDVEITGAWPEGCEGVVTRWISITSAASQAETRRFRVVGDTLHFLSHQSLLTKPFKV